MAKKRLPRTSKPDGISRRDFLNGILLAAGGIAVNNFFPMRLFANCGVNVTGCDGSIGLDPRALRGGNIPSVFTVGHWMRGSRLTFSTNSVTIAPSIMGCDDVQGTFPLLNDNGTYDAIIIGSGISGLSAAFYILRRRPGTRILILDGNPAFGGNAGRDDLPPIPGIASSAGAYAVSPYDDFLFEIYRTTGIDWASHHVPDPFYSYFFDDRTPYVNPGTSRWTTDVYGKGLKDMPYPKHIIQHLKQAKQDFRNWYHRNGSPTDPADRSDPKFDYLAGMTLHHYLTGERGWHPAVSDFYTRFAVDALAGTSEQVNAYTAISFLGAEYFPIFSFPGGTSGIARHILKWLIPQAISGTATDQILASSINTSALDDPNNIVRVRQNAMALRADTNSSSASVVYRLCDNFYRATAKTVLLAGQSHTTQRMARHLFNAKTQTAWEQFSLAPVVTANVTLKRASPLVDLGLGFNQYWWGSQYWADFVIADWVGTNRYDHKRPVVLTFFGANTEPPENMPAEREKLLNTPFGSYEDSLRSDLNRILASAGFDFDRDVSAVYIYRWGHGMIYPKPGFPFGPPVNQNGRAVRTTASRHIARAQLGRISFAGQDTEGSPSIESAIGSGLRTAEEVLSLL